MTVSPTASLARLRLEVDVVRAWRCARNKADTIGGTPLCLCVPKTKRKQHTAQTAQSANSRWWAMGALWGTAMYTETRQIRSEARHLSPPSVPQSHGSRRRDCHVDDPPCLSLLKHPLKVERGLQQKTADAMPRHNATAAVGERSVILTTPPVYRD